MAEKIQITGACRTSQEAKDKMRAWLAAQERSGVKIESYKLSILVGRASWGTFHAVEYDPDGLPPKHVLRDPKDPLPLP